MGEIQRPKIDFAHCVEKLKGQGNVRKFVVREIATQRALARLIYSLEEQEQQAPAGGVGAAGSSSSSTSSSLICQIILLFVSPSLRGMGMGRLLMAQLIAHLALMRVACTIKLVAEEECSRLGKLQRYYEDLGFRICPGVRIAYFQTCEVFFRRIPMFMENVPVVELSPFLLPTSRPFASVLFGSERYYIHEVEEGALCFASTNSQKYLCVEPDGRVVADRTRAQTWERFHLIFSGEKHFALRTWHGQWLKMEIGGEHHLLRTSTFQDQALWRVHGSMWEPQEG